MSIEWILPIAFYRVAEKCTPAQLLHGIVVDGVPFNLTPQDKLTSIEYSLAIGRAAYAEVTQFLVSWGAPCYKPDKEHCLKTRLEACAMVERRRAENLFPLNLWTTEELEACLCSQLQGCNEGGPAEIIGHIMGWSTQAVWTSRMGGPETDEEGEPRVGFAQ
jgi:hypothetical protein